MKNLNEKITEALETNKDGFIYAVRKSDDYTGIVAILWEDDNDSFEEIFAEATKKANKLINFSKWEISHFIVEFDN